MTVIERLNQALGVNLVRITFYLQCWECGRVWTINVRDGQPLSLGWKICRACGAKAVGSEASGQGGMR